MFLESSNTLFHDAHTVMEIGMIHNLISILSNEEFKTLNRFKKGKY